MEAESQVQLCISSNRKKMSNNVAMNRNRIVGVLFDQRSPSQVINYRSEILMSLKRVAGAFLRNRDCQNKEKISFIDADCRET